MTKTENLQNIYLECSNGYHKIDDFRAKLLGFLPLASGVGIFGTLYLEPNKNIISSNFVALGSFGLLVTLGLLIFELKGILKCTQFIFLGTWIESKLKENAELDKGSENGFEKLLTGYFTELSQREAFMGKVVNEPVASAIIYSTVMSAWTYVIFLNSGNLKFIIPLIVFSVFAISIYKYWRIIYNNIKESYDNSPDPETGKPKR